MIGSAHPSHPYAYFQSLSVVYRFDIVSDPLVYNKNDIVFRNKFVLIQEGSKL